jgi:hypothetical protein
VLVGRVRRGIVAPGMDLSVPFNGSLSVVLRIGSVDDGEDAGEIVLSLSCSDAKEADLLMALNLPNQEFACQGEDQ